MEKTCCEDSCPKKAIWWSKKVGTWGIQVKSFIVKTKLGHLTSDNMEDPYESLLVEFRVT